MSRFQFVADHRHAFEVKRLCALVEVARSSFYAWLAGEPRRQQRTVADAELAERIRQVHDQDRALARHGSPPNSTTAHRRRRGSTTSESPG